MPPLLVLPHAWRLRAHCDRPPAPIDASQASVTHAAMASGALGVITGLVIAFGTESPVSDAWWAGPLDGVLRRRRRTA